MIEYLTYILPSLIQLGLWCMVTALYVVLGILNRRHIAKRWKPGLLLSCALLAMMLPSVVFSAAYLDLSSLKSEVLVGLAIGVFFGFIIQILKLAWTVILFGVAEAEWNAAGWGHSLSPEQRRHPTWRELAPPFLIGLAAAAVSSTAFDWLDVKEGPIMDIIRTLMPDSVNAPAFITVPMSCLVVTAIAVSEELAYRGGVLAFLLRVTRRNRVLTWLAVILLNLPWALAHIPNTDRPVIKVSQMMVLGIIFTILAKNRSMRSAIAAHVGLNLGAMALAFGSL